MSIKLPPLFIKKMQNLLGDEFSPFMSSYDESRYYGIRVNTLKISIDEFKKRVPFHLRPIPWIEEGFYYEADDRPGKHPYYHAGLYYMQEPSAMVPAQVMDVQPGDRVLDLCAAPGGKSTQLAAKLAHQGVLVLNDISADRAKTLAKNVDLFGVRQAIIFNETPERLAARFGGYFDKILIDAPCSGEGMFRKDEDMAKKWDVQLVEACVVMQRDILDEVEAMLAPGGKILYSTCTFSPEENEAMIAEFLHKQEDFDVDPLDEKHGFSAGRPEWIDETNEAHLSEREKQAVKGTIRLWPHKLQGEGHYVAVLKRNAAKEMKSISHEAVQCGIIQPEDYKQWKKDVLREVSFVQPPVSKKTNKLHWTIGDVKALLEQFCKDHLLVGWKGNIVIYADYVYLSPQNSPDLAGLKVIRAGWYLGTLKKNRFVPSHALATGLRHKDVVRWIDFAADSDDAVRYLRGETLTIAEDRVILNDPQATTKGLALICMDGFSVGWGKWLDGMLKNEYPPGWRRL